jgi:hypothetical protein
MKVAIDEMLEKGIRDRAIKRGISFREAVRQIMVIGWPSWKSRGRIDRLRREAKQVRGRCMPELENGRMVWKIVRS